MGFFMKRAGSFLQPFLNPKRRVCCVVARDFSTGARSERGGYDSPRFLTLSSLGALRAPREILLRARCELVSEFESNHRGEYCAAWWGREFLDVAARFAHGLVYNGVAGSLNDFKFSDRPVRLDP
jgi:hypothetical protein